MTKTIAILGLGAMGARMAARLLDARHDVTVYNRTMDRARELAAQGARTAESPRQAAEGCDVVISCVRDDDASRAVWLDPDRGALVALGENAVAIESSTLTVEWTRELAAAAAKRDVAFLDAPVAGSRPQAEAGQLIYLVGGDASTVETVRDVLRVMGGAVHHCGPSGSGMVMKLAVNALFGVQVAALAEVLGMTRKAGISDGQAIEVLGAMPITSPALKGIGALMAGRTFAPMFPIDLVEKDFGYVVATTSRLGGDSPVATAVRGVYARAKDAGLGGDNITGVVKVFE